MTPLGRRSGRGRRGQPGRPSAGYVGPGAVDVAGNQAGVAPVYAVVPPGGRGARVGARHGTLEAWSPAPYPARFPTPPARTSSSSRRAGALRGQGEVAAAPPQLLLPGPGRPRPPDGPDGRPGRPRRVDGGGHRGPRHSSSSTTSSRQYQPRYNVRLKDDKSYPWLAITVSDEWPRPAVVRGRKRRGVRYFGPYANVGAIRDTLDLLLRSFPVRTCSDTKFRRHQRLGRPCLLYHIERCSGPCVGAVDHEEYDRMVDDLIAFLGGDTGRPRTDSRRRCRRRRTALEFERASVLRDKLEARPGGRRRPPDGARAARGPRRVRRGRGRAGGGRPGVPRPVGEGGGPTGPASWTRWRT